METVVDKETCDEVLERMKKQGWILTKKTPVSEGKIRLSFQMASASRTPLYD